MKRFLPKPLRRVLGWGWVKARRVATFLRHLGWKKKCVICGWRFGSFIPGNPQMEGVANVENTLIGGGYRKNGGCPVCQCGDRERSAYLVLKSLFGTGAPLSVLHVAPERNLEKLFRKSPRISYTATDFQPEMYANVEQMDITDIHKPDNSYDVIVANHVLEHILEDKKAMRELYRVLKPGGWALLQSPVSRVLEETYEDASIVSEPERIKAFGQRDHVRIYGQDYTKRLEEAGFSLQLHTNAERYDTEYLGLVPDEVMYVCLKVPKLPKLERSSS